MFNYIHQWRKRLFVNIFSQIAPAYDESLSEEKKKLFSQIQTQTSHFPDLRKKGCLKILEIGGGSGTNIKYLPPNCHLTTLDPNEKFQEQYLKNLELCPGIHFEGYVIAFGEDLSDHFSPESFDAVVVSAVGCSVGDLDKFYDQIYKVLVPGGKFYYMEHIRDKSCSWRWLGQRMASLTGIWPLFGFGCHCDRQLDQVIPKMNFATVQQSLFEMSLKGFEWKHIVLAYLTATHVTGVAAKCTKGFL